MARRHAHAARSCTGRAASTTAARCATSSCTRSTSCRRCSTLPASTRPTRSTASRSSRSTARRSAPPSPTRRAPSPRTTQYFEMLGLALDRRRRLEGDDRPRVEGRGRRGAPARGQPRLRRRRVGAVPPRRRLRRDPRRRRRASRRARRRCRRGGRSEAERNQVFPLVDELIGRIAAVVPVAQRGARRARSTGPRVARCPTTRWRACSAASAWSADVDVPDDGAAGVLARDGRLDRRLRAVRARRATRVRAQPRRRRGAASRARSPSRPVVTSSPRVYTPGLRRARRRAVPRRRAGRARGAARCSAPMVFQHGGTVLMLGRDRGLPVCDDYEPPFPWTGTLHERRDRDRPRDRAVARRADARRCCTRVTRRLPGRLRREPHLGEGRRHACRPLAAAAPRAGVRRRRGQEVRRRPRAASSPRSITYYGFLAMFPLLLVLRHRARLRRARRSRRCATTSSTPRWPTSRSSARSCAATSARSAATASRSSIGLLALVWGSLGVAQVAQHAMAQVWNVPGARRPGFVPRLVRSLLVLAVLALAIVGDRGAHRRSRRWCPAAVAVADPLDRCCVVVLNVALYWLAFRVLTPERDRVARPRPGRGRSAGWRGPRSRRSGRLAGGAPAAPHQRALRHLRRRARAALLPVPRGADHRLRRRGQRGAGAPPRAAVARSRRRSPTPTSGCSTDVAETEQRRPEQTVDVDFEETSPPSAVTGRR